MKWVLIGVVLENRKRTIMGSEYTHERLVGEKVKYLLIFIFVLEMTLSNHI